MNQRVEQAIFTSARGDDLDGYQLTARSAGIDDELARQLACWGPAHDSLLDPAPAARSLNFTPLGDEWFALSQTTRQGAEYSGRGGGCVCTQFFLLPVGTLLRFHNHPLAIWRALVAAGRVRLAPNGVRELAAFTLVGNAREPAPAAANSAGSSPVAELAEAVRGRLPAAVVGGANRDWLSSLLAALETTERTQLSFTTGLKPSTRRPFLICTLPDQPAALRQAERHGVRIVRIPEEPVCDARYTTGELAASA